MINNQERIINLFKKQTRKLFLVIGVTLLLLALSLILWPEFWAYTVAFLLILTGLGFIIRGLRINTTTQSTQRSEESGFSSYELYE